MTRAVSTPSTETRQDDAERDPESECGFCGHPWRTHGPGACYVERAIGGRLVFCRCHGFRAARS